MGSEQMDTFFKISQLYAHQTQGIDEGDIEEYSGTFASQAVIVNAVNGSRLTGRDDIHSTAMPPPASSPYGARFPMPRRFPTAGSCGRRTAHPAHGAMARAEPGPMCPRTETGLDRPMRSVSRRCSPPAPSHRASAS